MPARYPKTATQHRLLLLLLLLVSLVNATPTRASSRHVSNITNGGGSWRRHNLIDQSPRQEYAVTSIGEDVYIIGGVTYDEKSEVETLNRVEFCNTAYRTWHVVASLPTPLNHANAASVDGKIYVLALQRYVVESVRGSSAVGVHGSKIHLAGGMTLLQAYQSGHQNNQATVSPYDTKTDTWDTDYRSLPEPRQHVGFATVVSMFYVIGGREDGVYQFHNTTYAMDLRDPTHWTTLAPMPTARGSLSCAPIGHRIYCFGGEGNRDNPGQIFNETQVYDTKIDIWKNLLPKEVPRHGTGAVAGGNEIYMPGGGVTTAFYPTGINDAFVPEV